MEKVFTFVMNLFTELAEFQLKIFITAAWAM